MSNDLLDKIKNGESITLDDISKNDKGIKIVTEGKDISCIEQRKTNVLKHSQYSKNNESHD